MIKVLPLGDIEPGILSRVTGGLCNAFDVRCCVQAQEPLPFFAYHDERGQYCSTDILHWLLANRASAGDKVLAVIQYDVFSPLFTFVFGEAQLGGSVAVFSTFRLRNERYGLPPHHGLLEARSIKEAVHEAGHTFGHRHCPDPECVMRFSQSVEHIDLKRAVLCRSCGVAHRGRCGS